MAQPIQHKTLTGEEYPVGLKTPLTNLEVQMYRRILPVLEANKRRTLAFIHERINITKMNGIYGSGVNRRVKSEIRKRTEDRLIIKALNLGDGYDQIYSNLAWFIDNKALIPVFTYAVNWQNQNIFQTLRNFGQSPDRIEETFGINFNMPGREVRFIDSLERRQRFLGKVLEEDTLKKTFEMVEIGIREGKTFDQIAKQMEDAGLFSRERGRLIARTETNWALNEGTRQHLETIGVERYTISPAPTACKLCKQAATKTYPVTKQIMPIHPNDRCPIIAVIPKDWFPEGYTPHDAVIPEIKHTK